MSELKSIRLDGTITLLAPLSHIGESTGPDSWLSQDIIIGPDGHPVECFVYSGNAFRGILRDLAAQYMLDKLGGMRLPLDAFYLLFSGGALGGQQSLDIDQARMYRRNIPMLSIFGGGVGNQILNGKMKIGAMYPLVEECQRVLPQYLRQENAPSWKQWTFEKSFTRMDDAKNENRRTHLAQDALPAAEPTLALGDADPETGEVKPKKKEKDAPQQMRYTVEMLAAGAVLYQRVDLVDMADTELGAFVSALAEFSKNPYIGGKSGTGHGLCDIEYTWRPAGTNEKPEKFMAISTNTLWLSEPAEQAKQTYDQFLLSLYNQYLEDNQAELKQLMGGSTK
jgi:CRISPR type IV-associated protein Csf2